MKADLNMVSFHYFFRIITMRASLISSLFTLFLVTAFTCHSVAQISFKLGLVSASQIRKSGSFRFNSKSRLGWQVELQYQKELSNHFDGIAGVAFTTKGTDRLRFDYLEVPLYLVYKIPVGSHKIRVHFGPYLAILINVTDGERNLLTGQETADIGYNFGLEIPFKNSAIGVNMSRGWVDINRPQNGNYLRNRYESIYLRFRF